MGRGKLTRAEIEKLRKNPNVISVGEDRIVYSDEFKKHFITEYMKGEKPGNIFREAGFDIKVLGSKRIERACARWRESFASGTLGLYKDRGTSLRREGKCAADKENVVTRAEDVAQVSRMSALEEQIEEQRIIICDLEREVKRLRRSNERLRENSRHG